jgi:Vesicle coat protein involved in Golgi to plasma membrane transport
MVIHLCTHHHLLPRQQQLLPLAQQQQVKMDQILYLFDRNVRPGRTLLYYANSKRSKAQWYVFYFYICPHCSLPLSFPIFLPLPSPSHRALSRSPSLPLQPVLMVPRELQPQEFDLEQFVLRVLAIDFQNKSRASNLSAGLITVPGFGGHTEELQSILHERDRHVYVHHLHIPDFQARGFSRPLCLCYVTAHPDKVVHQYEEISQRFQDICTILRDGAKRQFRLDLDACIARTSDQIDTPQCSPISSQSTLPISSASSPPSSPSSLSCSDAPILQQRSKHNIRELLDLQAYINTQVHQQSVVGSAPVTPRSKPTEPAVPSTSLHHLTPSSRRPVSTHAANGTPTTAPLPVAHSMRTIRSICGDSYLSAYVLMHECLESLGSNNMDQFFKHHCLDQLTPLHSALCIGTIVTNMSPVTNATLHSGHHPHQSRSHPIPGFTPHSIAGSANIRGHHAHPISSSPPLSTRSSLLHSPTAQPNPQTMLPGSPGVRSDISHSDWPHQVSSPRSPGTGSVRSSMTGISEYSVYTRWYDRHSLDPFSPVSSHASPSTRRRHHGGARGIFQPALPPLDLLRYRSGLQGASRLPAMRSRVQEVLSSHSRTGSVTGSPPDMGASSSNNSRMASSESTTTARVVSASPQDVRIHLLHVFGEYACHLLFSVMIGRPVLVTGSVRSRTAVERAVAALAVFLPGLHHQHVVSWATAASLPQLSVADMEQSRIMGVCKDVMIPESLHEFVSIYDTDVHFVMAPSYRNLQYPSSIMSRVLHKSKRWKSPVLFVRHIHNVMIEVSIKCFIYYHLCCVGIELPTSDNRRRFHNPYKVLRMLHLSSSDADIVVRLCEMVKEQQMVAMCERQSCMPTGACGARFTSTRHNDNAQPDGSLNSGNTNMPMLTLPPASPLIGQTSSPDSKSVNCESDSVFDLQHTKELTDRDSRVADIIGHVPHVIRLHCAPPEVFSRPTKPRPSKPKSTRAAARHSLAGSVGSSSGSLSRHSVRGATHLFTAESGFPGTSDDETDTSHDGHRSHDSDNDADSMRRVDADLSALAVHYQVTEDPNESISGYVYNGQDSILHHEADEDDEESRVSPILSASNALQSGPPPKLRLAGTVADTGDSRGFPLYAKPASALSRGTSP